MQTRAKRGFERLWSLGPFDTPRRPLEAFKTVRTKPVDEIDAVAPGPVIYRLLVAELTFSGMPQILMPLALGFDGYADATDCAGNINFAVVPDMEFGIEVHCGFFRAEQHGQVIIAVFFFLWCDAIVHEEAAPAVSGVATNPCLHATERFQNDNL